MKAVENAKEAAIRRRWHITLSRFLRDYLYIPLGGNRLGPSRRYTNVMVVMLLGGLWHGASWNFVAWGGLHGLYLCINHGWRFCFPGLLSGAFGRATAWLVTFLAVMLAWVPFRAVNFESTLRIYETMAGLRNFVLPKKLADYLGPQSPAGLDAAMFDNAYYHIVKHAFGLLGDVPVLPLAVIVAFFLPNAYAGIGRFEPYLGWDRREHPALWSWLRWWPTPLYATLVAGLTAVAIVRQGDPYTFLYFQF